MGTTPALGFPYPEDTDPVNQGARAIKALATAVEPYAPRQAGGAVSVHFELEKEVWFPITFPVGLFLGAPLLLATTRWYEPSALAFSASAAQITTGGGYVVVTAVRDAAVYADVRVDWWALEVLPRPAADLVVVEGRPTSELPGAAS